MPASSSDDAADAVLLLVAGCAAVALTGVAIVFTAAHTAHAITTREPAPITYAGTARALPDLAKHAAHPGRAWATEAPHLHLAPEPFWAITAALTIAALLAATVLIRRLGHRSIGSAPRERLTVDANPHLATVRDLRPLITTPRRAAGRFVLARFGRHLLATQTGRPSRWARLRRRHPGGRGAVAIIGPSQSGKTTTVVAALLDWDGPIVCSSVKVDLIAPTIGHRASRGEIAVFDPADDSAYSSCSWSPLRAAADFEAAADAAKRIFDATPRGRGTVTNEAFWDNLAQQLLATCFWVAATNDHCSMSDVVRWITSHDGTDPTDSEIYELLESAKPPGHPGPLGAHVPTAARSALEPAERAQWEDYERAIEPLRGIRNAPADTRSSIYVTAQTLIWPWSQRSGAASADGSSIDLDWLYADTDAGRASTLYITAPLNKQQRYAPVIGGLLGDLFDQVFSHHTRTGQRLDPPLLVVIDEAAQTPLESLPRLAATVAGLGVQLVTVWQSKAQLDATFGPSADTVLTNHPTKLFFGGISDSATLNYVRDLSGSEHVATRSLSHPVGLLATGQRNETATTHELPLLPAHVIRQQPHGSALLVHGNLPPASVRGRYAPRERHLRSRHAVALPAGTPTSGPSDVGGSGAADRIRESGSRDDPSSSDADRNSARASPSEGQDSEPAGNRSHARPLSDDEVEMLSQHGVGVQLRGEPGVTSTPTAEPHVTEADQLACNLQPAQQQLELDAGNSSSNGDPREGIDVGCDPADQAPVRGLERPSPQN